jgi:diguanylate cyclase (GGDEF)-like protein
MKTFPTTLLSLERIFSISHEIIANPSLEDILHSIVQAASDLVACEGASIMLLDGSSNVLTFVAATKDRILSYLVPIEHSIAGAAFNSNSPVMVPDVSKDSRYFPKIDGQINFATHSVLAVPLTFRESRIGVIEVLNKKQGQFDEADVAVLVVLATQATITIEIGRLYRQAQEEIGERIKVEEELRRHQDHLEELVKERTAEVHRLAITDSLTGLFNRGHLMLLGNKAMQQAQRYRKPFSAMFIDIDHFKQINDKYSHATGDEALRKLADILLQKSRSADIAGRYGGEEFVVLMPDTNLQSAFELAERLLNQIRVVRIDTTQSQISLTASIGVVEMDQTHPQTLDSLLDKADEAHYAAKHAGRDQVFVGNEEHLSIH